MAYYFAAGRKYGRLTALEDGNKTADLILFRCDCGTEKRIKVAAVISNNTRSCGCLKSAADAARNQNNKYGLTYGLSDHPLYRTWQMMKDRCYNHRNRKYSDYGGRGIFVCDRWRAPKTGFRDFLSDMGEKPYPSYSLERTDKDGPYSPENCEWASIDVQLANRRKQIRNSEYAALGAENERLRGEAERLYADNLELRHLVHEFLEEKLGITS